MKCILIIKNAHADNSIFDKSNLWFLHFSIKGVFPQNLNYKQVWDAWKTKNTPAPQLTVWRQRPSLILASGFTKQLKRC